MFRESFGVGEYHFIGVPAEHSRIFACCLICVQLILCAEVVDSSGKLQGVGDVPDYIIDPCDSAKFSCGKAQRSSAFVSISEIQHKVIVGLHSRSLIVIHPCRAQGHGVRAYLQCALLRKQLMPAVMVLRRDRHVFGQESCFQVAVIDLV